MVCRQCGRELVAELPSPEEAQKRLAEQRARKALIAMPRRRQTAPSGSEPEA
jgi:hypothetical protein